MLYPTGWYKFDDSKRIKKGKIYTLNCFGKAFVCFRASDDSVHVYDAYCPHLGAHLGVGGKILEDNIICPFHGWKFNRSGDCVEIPYCKSIPKRAQLGTYPAREVGRVIFIYYSDDLRQPEGDLPRFLQNTELQLRQVSTLLMDQDHFEKLPEIANTVHMNLESNGPGFFSDLETQPSSEFRIVIASTPLNEKQSTVSFSYSLERGTKFMRILSLRKKIKGQVKAVFDKVLEIQNG